MADENSAAAPETSQESEARGGRTGGAGRSDGGGRGEAGRSGAGRDREAGGFRIRLSDNELRAARAVQDAFQLRSTVAALGFSIRTVAQLLEQGQLDQLVAQQRTQAGARPDVPREGGRGHRGEGRPEGRGEGRGEPRGDRRPSRPDPFARPSRPQAPAGETTESAAAAAELPEASLPEVVISEFETTQAPAAPEVAVAVEENAELQP